VRDESTPVAELPRRSPVNRLASRHEPGRSPLTCESRPDRDEHAIEVSEPFAPQPAGPRQLTWEMFFDLMHGAPESISPPGEEVDDPRLSEQDAAAFRPSG
jgi:hypothetical protein